MPARALRASVFALGLPAIAVEFTACRCRGPLASPGWLVGKSRMTQRRARSSPNRADSTGQRSEASADASGGRHNQPTRRKGTLGFPEPGATKLGSAVDAPFCALQGGLLRRAPQFGWCRESPPAACVHGPDGLSADASIDRFATSSVLPPRNWCTGGSASLRRALNVMITGRGSRGIRSFHQGYALDR